MTLMDSLELQQWEVKELLPNLRLLNANFDRFLLYLVYINVYYLEVKESLPNLRLLTAKFYRFLLYFR